MLKIVYQNAVKAAVLFSIFHRKTRRFSHELKHLYFITGSTQPSAFPLADTAAQPLEATLCPRRACALAAARRRGGVPPSGGGDQRGQGTDGSLSPLDTPDPPLDATPSGRATKCEGPTGASGAPRAHP